MSDNQPSAASKRTDQLFASFQEVLDAGQVPDIAKCLHIALSEQGRGDTTKDELVKLREQVFINELKTRVGGRLDQRVVNSAKQQQKTVVEWAQWVIDKHAAFRSGVPEKSEAVGGTDGDGDGKTETGGEGSGEGDGEGSKKEGDEEKETVSA